MSKTKSAGSTSLGRDSRPKYLGVKLSGGQKAQPGSILCVKEEQNFCLARMSDAGKTILFIQLSRV